MAIQVRTVDVIDVSYYLHTCSLYRGCRIESNNSYTGMNQTADVTYMSFVFVIWAHLELSQSLLVTILHSIILCQSVEIIYHYKSNEYFVSKYAIKTQTKEVLVSFPRICQGHSVKLFNRPNKSRDGPFSDQLPAIPTQTSTPEYDRTDNPTFVVTDPLTMCDDDIQRITVMLYI